MIRTMLPFVCLLWTGLMATEDIRGRYLQAMRYACLVLLTAGVLLVIELNHHNALRLVILSVTAVLAVVQLVTCRHELTRLFRPINS